MNHRLNTVSAVAWDFLGSFEAFGLRVLGGLGRVKHVWKKARSNGFLGAHGHFCFPSLLFQSILDLIYLLGLTWILIGRLFKIGPRLVDLIDANSMK